MSNLDQINRILTLLSEGDSAEAVADSFGLPVSSVAALQEQALQIGTLHGLRKKSQSSRHQLTSDERRRGQLAGEPVRQAARQSERNKIIEAIEKEASASVRISAVAYYLSKGSKKEFSVTILAPEVGLLYWQALKTLQAPKEKVVFQWRNADKSSLPSSWSTTNLPILFAAAGSINTMRLRVAGFPLCKFSISSRILGQTFSDYGKYIINYYTHE